MNEVSPRWLLKAIRESGGEFESQFAGIPAAAARWRPGDDDWCLTELFGHLCDTEALYLERLTRLVEMNNPALPDIDAQFWPRERDYAARRLGGLIHRFATARQDTVELLWTLEPGEWHRAGEHPYRGRLTLTDVVQDVKEHDLQHLWQARRLLQGFEGAQALPAASLSR